MTYDIVNTTTGKTLESWNTGAQALWAMLNLIDHCRKCGVPNAYRINGATAWTLVYVDPENPDLPQYFTTLAVDEGAAATRLTSENPSAVITHIVEGRIR